MPVPVPVPPVGMQQQQQQQQQYVAGAATTASTPLPPVLAGFAGFAQPQATQFQYTPVPPYAAAGMHALPPVAAAAAAPSPQPPPTTTGTTTTTNDATKRAKRAEQERDRRARRKQEQEGLRTENVELRREREALIRQLEDLEREFAATKTEEAQPEVAKPKEELHVRAILDVENILLKAQIAQHELFVRAVRQCSTLDPRKGATQQLPSSSASSWRAVEDAVGVEDEKSTRSITKSIALQTMEVTWTGLMRIIVASKWHRDWSAPVVLRSPELDAAVPGSAFALRWRRAEDGTLYIRADFFVPTSRTQGNPPPATARNRWYSIWVDPDAMASVFPRVFNEEGERTCELKSVPLFSLDEDGSSSVGSVSKDDGSGEAGAAAAAAAAAPSEGTASTPEPAHAGAAELKIATTHLRDRWQPKRDGAAVPPDEDIVDVYFLSATRRDSLPASSLRVDADTLELLRKSGFGPAADVEEEEGANARVHDVFSAVRAISRDPQPPSAAPTAPALMVAAKRATWPFTGATFAWSQASWLRATSLTVYPPDLNLPFFGRVSEMIDADGGVSPQFASYWVKYAAQCLCP